MIKELDRHNFWQYCFVHFILANRGREFQFEDAISASNCSMIISWFLEEDSLVKIFLHEFPFLFWLW